MAAFTPKPGFRFNPFPPKEALGYFQRKGWAVGFDYRDVWRQQHAAAFTVAKATTMDVLGSIREAVDKALKEGQTFRQFQKELTPTLQALGWWGVKDVIDPLTGEKRPAQLGSPRRLKTIYDANLRTAYAAGDWERAQRARDSHPYLLYQLGPSKEHRLQHVAWQGLLLPQDDPWWDTHFPPNGWGCKCWTRAISHHEAERLIQEGTPDTTAPLLPGGHRVRRMIPVRTKAPPIRYRGWINTRTGQVEQVPEGIDPGWDTNPGKVQVDRLAAMAAEKRNALVGEPPHVEEFPHTIPPEEYRRFQEGAERRVLETGGDPRGLYAPEQASVYGFTSKSREWGSTALNRALRGTDPPAARQRLAPYIETLKTALEKLPDHPGWVHRSTRLPAADLARHVPGAIVTYEAFTSASAEWYTGNRHQFYIFSLHGKRIDWLSEHPHELEVLFRPGTRFLVLKRERVKGTLTLTLRELEPEGSGR